MKNAIKNKVNQTDINPIRWDSFKLYLLAVVAGLLVAFVYAFGR